MIQTSTYITFSHVVTKDYGYFLGCEKINSKTLDKTTALQSCVACLRDTF
jgi:hypothetical protein